MKVLHASLLLSVGLASLLPAQERIAYVGTFTTSAGTFVSAGSKGIYGFRFDPKTGKMTGMGLMADEIDPAWLAIHPNRRFLYSVNEVSSYQGQGTGAVSSFSIDPGTGHLKLLNRVSSRGGRPCHLAFDKTGKWLFVANFETGSVAVLPIHEDGTLGEASSFVQHTGSSVNPERQAGPHAHSANLSPDGRFVLVADLGLDRVFTYRFDPAKGTLAPADPPYAKTAAGTGPRHMAFAPTGGYAYLVSEMADTVTAFHYDPRAGSLQELQAASALPPDFSGFKSGAEIAVHPNGKFVYASNRGDASITTFRIDSGRGTITSAGRVSTQGKTPRNFALDPTGAFLFGANQDSGTIVEYRIDRDTGELTPTGEVLQVPSPVYIGFVPVQ